MIITAGSTNVTIDVYFVDDDGGTAPGEPTTGKLFSDIETGGSASYHRQGAARVDFQLFTQTAAGAHTDGGFVLIDDTNMPGLYRLDVPDAAFASGVDYVVIQLVAASANNAIMRPLLIDLTTIDLRDSVRGGMTSLPNAAADGAGGLPISDAGGLDLDTQLAATNEVTAARMGALTDWVDGGRLDLLIDAIPTTAMRGTDSAALASVATEARLAELDAANLPADMDLTLADTGELQADWANGGRLDVILDARMAEASISTTGGAVDTVTTVTTTTTNTDMVAAAPSVATILTTQMTEAYAADGAAPTIAQALMMIQQTLGEFAISGTTLTVKKVDGSTSAATFTLDDATTPTSLTRAT